MWINRVAGAVVIVMGLVFMGLIPGLSATKPISSKKPDAGLLGAPLMGLVFGLSWTPCIGPTYAAIVALSLDGGGDSAAVRGGVPGAGLLPGPRHPLRALRAAVRARARAEQEAVGPPPQHRPALRRAADRDRRAPDDRGVGELDRRLQGLIFRPSNRWCDGEKDPRPDRGVRTDDAERPGTGPAEAGAGGERIRHGPVGVGSWSSKPESTGSAPPCRPGPARHAAVPVAAADLHAGVALVLLMLLAVAAIPGFALPAAQREPGLTEQFLEENGRWGEILDALGNKGLLLAVVLRDLPAAVHLS